MDKKKFAEYVNKIKSYIEKERAIDNSLRALSPDFGGFSMGEVLDDIVELLAKNVGDTEWLSYYIWETDCGDNDCADSVSDKDGNRIPFKTPEDVYNLIMEDRIDEKDDATTNYLLNERDKYKRLYENEKDHSATLQKIIDKTTKSIMDDVVPEATKEVKKKTTTSGNTLTFDELIDVIADELLKEFGKDE